MTTPDIGRHVRGAMNAVTKAPWRLARLAPLLPQRRVQLLLGAPPLGPTGVWSAADPEAAYGQRPSPALLDLVLEAAREASRIELPLATDRATAVGSEFAGWINRFPGEHYRLLAALTRVLDPKLIVEIGTFTGASALAFLEHMPTDTRVVTYDIIPWNNIPATLLRAEDFEDGRLEQRIGDLSDAGYWASERQLFNAADLIFLDGPKDAVFEPLMLERLAHLNGGKSVLVVDDIRFLEMLEAWAKFPAPKLDVTTFGHWSGTGLALLGATPAE